MCAVDESGALSILQWVLSSRPEPAAAEQQLRAAWKMVSSHHAMGHGATAETCSFASLAGAALPVQQAANNHHMWRSYPYT
jgi:hypothetical protein